MGNRIASQEKLVGEILRRAPVLAGWPDAIVQALAGSAELWRFEKGERVVERHDPVGGLWLVVNGSLAAFRGSPTGRHMLIGIMWPGDLIGLLPILDGGLMPESHEARADTLLVFMPRPALQEALTDIGCLMSLVRAVCFRARLANESIYLRAKDSLRCQLAKFLVFLPRLTLTLPIGSPDGPAWIKSAPVNVTQGELASLLGVARQTVNRVMKEFLRKKIVARNGEVIEVIDVQQLLRIMEEDEPVPPRWRAEILSWENSENARASGEARAVGNSERSRASTKTR